MHLRKHPLNSINILYFPWIKHGFLSDPFPNKQFPNIELANSACVIENMTLAATDAGLGSVYILGVLSAFSADQTLISELNLPEGFVPVSGVVLGYPTKPLTQEKELKQIIKTNVIK